MSFQTYIKNIEEKTGKSRSDFEKIALEKGFTEDGKIKKGIKATEIINWLKEDFELGHGHATAMYAYINGKRE
ncbi:DUF4287 domain-containing protein [Elizabethkingia sp. HX WHF]|uniref:DUF4287 domain-containing protein n=1 Tax=Elizabethkingia bruuniana TaxID=1756149 RepID=A0A7T7UWW0_9FLAO|nr:MULTISPECIES: DUF4287 domain-containing protein [Elizabethkingia]ATL43270.1 DUF4287 domain-containing protein [Elizabethkingia miricola]AQX84234.1 hypothetical protein AYC65_04015 [Elizabethkingia bruuniana]KGO11004.1 hypothetical protein KS04_06145 [Elizabethkingia miricola]KUY28413.1 hypothetical protein ATB97_16010 [Elizabethkingia bruuniana]MCL1638662.1 DUF4287 domain-containing protein [Elizabethkingia bruuniana]